MVVLQAVSRPAGSEPRARSNPWRDRPAGRRRPTSTTVVSGEALPSRARAREPRFAGFVLAPGASPPSRIHNTFPRVKREGSSFNSAAPCGARVAGEGGPHVGHTLRQLTGRHLGLDTLSHVKSFVLRRYPYISVAAERCVSRPLSRRPRPIMMAKESVRTSRTPAAGAGIHGFGCRMRTRAGRSIIAARARKSPRRLRGLTQPHALRPGIRRILDRGRPRIGDPGGTVPCARVGQWAVVPRRVGGAVERNRARGTHPREAWPGVLSRRWFSAVLVARGRSGGRRAGSGRRDERAAARRRASVVSLRKGAVGPPGSRQRLLLAAIGLYRITLAGWLGSPNAGSTPVFEVCDGDPGTAEAAARP